MVRLTNGQRLISSNISSRRLVLENTSFLGFRETVAILGKRQRKARPVAAAEPGVLSKWIHVLRASARPRTWQYRPKPPVLGCFCRPITPF